MTKKSDKYNFVYDNKTHNWFVIDMQSDKYKFYAKITKGRLVKDWIDEYGRNYKKEPTN